MFVQVAKIYLIRLRFCLTATDESDKSTAARYQKKLVNIRFGGIGRKHRGGQSFHCVLGPRSCMIRGSQACKLSL